MNIINNEENFHEEIRRITKHKNGATPTLAYNPDGTIEVRETGKPIITLRRKRTKLEQI